MNGARAEAVLLDRDGVIIRARSDYVKSWSEVELIPRALAAIARMTSAGQRVAVITNQSAIGRGIISWATVDDIHHRLDGLIRRAGGSVAGYFVCPHVPSDDCACRKPKPGLLLQAARNLDVRMGDAVFVGDQVIDLEAADAAGCNAILVETGVVGTATVPIKPTHLRFPDLMSAAKLIAEEAPQRRM